MITIIIPAFNEETVIKDCLLSIKAQNFEGEIEILVIANGCNDGTMDICGSLKSNIEEKYHFKAIEIKQPNKCLALQTGDELANFENRIYLDADVTISINLVSQIAEVFENSTEPRFVSGSINIVHNKSYAVKVYSEIWMDLPYIKKSIPGCGLYAVNCKGRQLWGKFEGMLSDDKYVRLHFPVDSRIQVKAEYYWPLPKNLSSLIKTRIRWSLGNRQLQKEHPNLVDSDLKRIHIECIRLVYKKPIKTFIFCSIYIFCGIASYLKPLPKSKYLIEWYRSR